MKTFLLHLFLLPFLTTFGQITSEEYFISPGVVHKQITNSVDTLFINILKVDLTKTDYEIKSVKAKHLLNAKEKTSVVVKSLLDSNFNVISGLNADFFEADGETVNNMISDGEFVKAVKFTNSPFNDFVNSQFAITTDNKPLIEQFIFNGLIIFPNGLVQEISRINSLPDSNSFTLYSSFQGDFTPEAKDDWRVLETYLKPLQKSEDTLYFILSSAFELGGKTKIPDDGFILSANQKCSYIVEQALSLKDTIKILLNLFPNFSNIKTLVGGWPLLVKDGKNVIESNPDIEGVIPRFSEKRHPRTGIGFSMDSTSILFITVDGRQSISRGMTLNEFSDLMIEEGVYQGLNLDGGGSTTLIIKDKIVNSPSDKEGEREVGNCLLLIKKKE